MKMNVVVAQFQLILVWEMLVRTEMYYIFFADELYITEQGELCAECVLKMFEKVKVD